MKVLRNIYIQGLLILTAFSCSGGGDDGGDPTPPPVIDPPEATTLIFPENNTECNEGTILSDTESAVVFRWDASANTDLYEVNLRDLNTGSSRTLTSTVNQLEITILRGNPYAWSVTSRSNTTTQTAQSDEWKFYNAGLPTENFAPFPADLVSPKMGSSVDAASGTLLLEWEGNDIDNDIVSYDILFGTVNPPTELEGNTSSTTMEVGVSSGQTYYWRVITKDSQANTSQSEIFQFKVN
ncbi:hypothetical protein GWK08_14410 [Leptobacterium flavescens]|uniref:Fibronectin type-III domain-containing protein n=1 Tax=Leptobacterium flavescens TaxID=472055 RepID=A0A6P0UN99_9FLAO|nr:hypothetical protein [Leptobacterium flavescens]NER14645.1 hypothetical protein [Leptobacterium flavescens]